MAVQVDPIEPNLKLPGTKRLKLKCDILLSNFAFKFNLRSYSVGGPRAGARGQGLTLVLFAAQLKRFLWDRGAFRGCLGGV